MSDRLINKNRDDPESTIAAPHLELSLDDCSEIGILVLDYIKENELTFTKMAERVGISRAALRIACWKQGRPGKKAISKLSVVLQISENELRQMVC